MRFFTLHSEKLMIGAGVCPSLAVVIEVREPSSEAP